MFFVVYLSDIPHPSAAHLGAPGFRRPVEFRLCRGLGLMIMHGRIFDTNNAEDLAAYREESTNVFRGAHRHFFPLLMFLTPAQEIACGLVAGPGTPPIEEGKKPAEVVITVDAGASGEPENPGAPTATADPPSAPAPLSTAPARQKAHQLGVDLSLLRGTGTGGIITKEDVMAAWHATSNQGPPPAPPVENGENGRLSLSQLMATAP